MPLPKRLTSKSLQPLRFFALLFFAVAAGLLISFAWTRWQLSPAAAPSKLGTSTGPTPTLALTRRLEPTFDDQLHEDGWNLADGATYRLERKKYLDLDKIAAGLRRPEARFSEGSWMILRFYEGLSISQGEGDEKWQRHLQTLQAWREAAPQSITAILANAYAILEYAEKARKNPPTYKPLPNGPELQAQRLAKASALLDEVSDRRKECPGWFYLKCRLIEERADRLEDFESIKAEAIKLWPDFWQIYALKARFVNDRSMQGFWVKELESDCRNSTTLSDTIYARVAMSMCDRHNNVFEQTYLSSDRVMRGLDALSKRYPQAFQFDSARCKFYCFIGRREEARALFAKLENRVDRGTWPVNEFIAAKSWVQSDEKDVFWLNRRVWLNDHLRVPTPQFSLDETTPMRTVDLSPAEGEAIQKEFLKKLSEQRFDEIEGLADDFRKSEARTVNGGAKLVWYYYACRLPETATAEDFERLTENCHRWSENRPDSITAPVAEAMAEVEYARAIRRRGWVKDSDDAARISEHRIKKADRILSEAAKKPERCPFWYHAKAEVFIQTKPSLQTYNEMFRAAVAAFPHNALPYTDKVNFLKSLWTVRSDTWFTELEADTENENEFTDDAYARAIIYLVETFDLKPTEWPISRERVIRGSDANCRKFPQSLSHLTNRCQLACAMGDHDWARKAFAALGSRVDLSKWLNFEHFRAARNWADSEDPEPFSFEKVMAREREKNGEQKKDDKKRLEEVQAAQRFLTRFTKEPQRARFAPSL